MIGLWATVRAHSRVNFGIWGIGIAVFMLLGRQWLAVVTGLASGQTEPVGWIWGVVIASFSVYVLALILVGTGGALLLKDLFRNKVSST